MTLARAAAALAIPLAVAGVASAELQLASPFGDHMMVQAGKPVPVFGTDDPGTVVSVTFADETAEATAGDDGKWRVELPAVEDAGPYEVQIQTDDESITLADVLAGDVWLCSGQSNMKWPVRNSSDAGWAIEGGANDQIRLLQVPENATPEPAEDVEVEWAVASPQSVSDFSAVGYFFGRRLHMETNRPIGLINASWGGSKIQAWLPMDRLEDRDDFEKMRDTAQKAAVDWEARLKFWIDGGKQGPRPTPNGGGENSQLALLYNGMIHPLGELPITGVLWYQGESDSWQPDAYKTLFADLVEAYREQFVPKGDALPVYFVQLPNFAKPPEDVWRRFRDAQRDIAEELEDVDMVVTIDVGESDDIHPRQKKIVGERLALLAQRDVYGMDVLAKYPTPREVELQDDGSVKITYDHVGDGLRLKQGDEPLGFVLVDASNQSKRATAELVGDDAVVVRAEGIATPDRVRYAYEPDPKVNLVNSGDLPAMPFQVKVD